MQLLESQSEEGKNKEIMVEAAIQIKYTSTQSNNAPNLRSLSPQSTSQCKIFWLNGDTLSVRQDRCLQTERWGMLCSFLESHNGRQLEAEISLQCDRQWTKVMRTQNWTYLEILCDFTDKTLEGEELSRFLVTTNFTKKQWDLTPLSVFWRQISNEHESRIK
jgi:hypothetical protein